MARYQFTLGKEYAGRLHRIWRKPVENSGLALLRLEFEVFQWITPNRVSSTGKVACRDVVVGPPVDATRDDGVCRLASGVGVSHAQDVDEWLRLNNRSVWVKIVFGPPADLDERNPFVQLSRLDAADLEAIEYDYDLERRWVTVSAAADDLECSQPTVRRAVAQLEGEFGERLVRWTNGGHRRINIRLLKNLR